MRKLICTLAAMAMFSAFSLATRAADLAKGKFLAERCAACHGQDMNMPVLPEYPKLAGQHADYLYAAMRAYQIGSSNPLFGRDNLIMRAQLQNLSENDLHDIAAYLESLPGSLVDRE